MLLAGGYTLNKAALKMLVATFPTVHHMMSRLKQISFNTVPQKEGIEPYRTTDEAGAERYNHGQPEFEFNFDPKKNPLFRYSYFSGNENIGPERVVKVQFHFM